MQNPYFYRGLWIIFYSSRACVRGKIKMATVLIVDDSRTSRKILRNCLEKDNFTVVGEAGIGE
jgi:PleD family two-component response regulator